MKAFYLEVLWLCCEKPSSSGASHGNYSHALLKAHFVHSVWGAIGLLKRQRLEELPYVSDRILSLDLLYLVSFALHLHFGVLLKLETWGLLLRLKIHVKTFPFFKKVFAWG